MEKINKLNSEKWKKLQKKKEIDIGNNPELWKIVLLQKKLILLPAFVLFLWYFDIISENKTIFFAYLKMFFD